MENFSSAMLLLWDPYVLIALLVGTGFGIVVGALPGLGSVLAITIALPFTYSMDTMPSIALILAIYCASIYGGSISAILINTPGTPASAATVLDGFPMTQQGKADLALGWATIGSLLGGLFSAVVLMIMAPQLAEFALRFGAVETFSLIALALTCIAGVSRDSMIKGLLAGCFGLLLATVGADTMSGTVRYNFGVFQLSSGFALIPVVVGIFAFSEVISRIGEKTSASAAVDYTGSRLPKLKEVFQRWKTLLRSSIIGTAIGILPGTGAATASFIAYSDAKRFGRYKENFGKGEPEGVLASESANNAVTGGALIPTLALGIPGDPVTAVMMSALIIHGITPGVRLFADQAVLMNASFIALFIANILFFIIGILSAKWVAKILRMPEPILLTIVMILSIVGTYGVSGNIFDVYISFIFGIVGYAFRLAAVPLAPIVIGLVLGPPFEESLRQGLLINDGRFLAFFSPTEHPISLILILITLIIIAVSTFKELIKK